MVAKFKKVKDSELGLFAIFDGHLGHDVADYLQSHLFDNIINEVTLVPFIFVTHFFFSLVKKTGSASCEVVARLLDRNRECNKESVPNYR